MMDQFKSRLVDETIDAMPKAAPKAKALPKAAAKAKALPKAMPKAKAMSKANKTFCGGNPALNLPLPVTQSLFPMFAEIPRFEDVNVFAQIPSEMNFVKNQ